MAVPSFTQYSYPPRKGEKQRGEAVMIPNTCPCWVCVDAECPQQYPCRGDIPSVVLQEHLGTPGEDGH